LIDTINYSLARSQQQLLNGSDSMISRVPISRQLTLFLIIPCIAITALGLRYLFVGEDKDRIEKGIIFILCFGIPALIFGFSLLNKRIQFNDREKVRGAERLLRFPFSSFTCLLLIILSTFPIVGGLSSIGTQTEALPILLVGLALLIMTVIAHEHPRIWFADTINLEDTIEQIQNTPLEDFPAFQDGIFSYTDSGFMATLKSSTVTVSWDEINLITAHKIDLLTIDCIVIEVHLRDTFITINDETPGHMKFMNIAAEKLQGFNKDWFSIVAFPAFKTNLTTVFERIGSNK